MKKVKVTFTERFRLVSWDNAISLEQDDNAGVAFTRHRTQFGVEWIPSLNYVFNVQLGNEFRYYTVPTDIDFDFNEIFIDQLNVRINKPLDLPVWLTVGRQNIMLGEGFVMFDGSPLDGSRSAYFNAIRLDWRPGGSHELTAFYTKMNKTDDFLPVIDEEHQALVEQPEEGAGVYYQTAVGNDTKLHGYFIYKHSDARNRFGTESTIYAPGCRLLHYFSKETVWAFEGNYQFGKHRGYDRSAFGGYTYLFHNPHWRKGVLLPPPRTEAGVGLSQWRVPQ